jgi:hypothetical protein
MSGAVFRHQGKGTHEDLFIAAYDARNWGHTKGMFQKQIFVRKKS